VNPPSTTSRGVFLARTRSNSLLCAEHYRLTLEVDGFPIALPGQFVQILCANPMQPEHPGPTFIRRPFSIGGLRRCGETCDFDIYHRVVGPGTRWLEQLSPEDPVDILGPLGQPFPIVHDRSIALLVGGGIGLPPLIWLAEALQSAGKRTIAFIGARSAEQIPLTRVPGVPIEALTPAPALQEFAQFGAPIILATNDGSLGSHGYIPDTLAQYLQAHPDLANQAVVYTCGPEPMMRAVAPICEERGIRCFVCLERVMACGMGTCQSCVVPVRDAAAVDGWRYRLCCTDGPVFESRTVLWNGR
jgi:dihydroorotate dehydrogenase electron transfer subunit